MIPQYRYNSDGWRYYRKRGTLNPVYSIRDGSISLAEYTGTKGGGDVEHRAARRHN